MLRFLKFRSKEKSDQELKIIRFIIKQFGYRPKELSFFNKALTHKSISNISKDKPSNERLEFLGDAILDAIVAEYLFVKFPEADEGYLTKVKAKIVSRKTLASIAAQMSLKDYILFQKGRSIKIATLEGNAFEALIGAIYLDSGFENTYKVVVHHVFRLYLDLTSLLEKEIDFKSKLFIWAQKNKLELEFKVLREDHKDGTWEYEIEAVINERTYGKGVGESKKAAEQIAARETLSLMGEI